jgi:hypothetical protein
MPGRGDGQARRPGVPETPKSEAHPGRPESPGAGCDQRAERGPVPGAGVFAPRRCLGFIKNWLTLIRMHWDHEPDVEPSDRSAACLKPQRGRRSRPLRVGDNPRSGQRFHGNAGGPGRARFEFPARRGARRCSPASCGEGFMVTNLPVSGLTGSGPQLEWRNVVFGFASNVGISGWAVGAPAREKLFLLIHEKTFCVGRCPYGVH